MEHFYKIIPQENLVLNTIVGRLTYDAYVALINSIMDDAQFRPSMNMFWDFRNGTLEEFSSSEIKSIKLFIEKNQEKRGDHYRVAFLVNNALDFGLSRMYQILSESLPVTFEVFYDEQEARDWINAKL
jgi:hypothetical protein